jgi:glc operon protein GlcG
MTSRSPRLVAVLVALATGATARADGAMRPVLTLERARVALAAAVEHAHALAAPGAAIAIVDEGGSIVLLERLDGTFPAGPDISVGKARTAAAFQKPTRVFEDLVNKGRVTMTTLPQVTHFTPLQGGVPLVIAGQVVGGIGVSGAASAAEDDEISQAGADGLGKSAATPAATVVPAARVAQAFAAGDTLVRTGDYTVNASRRDGPGAAEVHARDTDIFYVLSGHAQLVTGGELRDAKAAGPDELRGAAITGGTERPLAPGDVVTIPRGVPHWFARVDAPFTYFVVKSTTASP